MGAALISAARIGGGFSGLSRDQVVKVMEDNIQNAAGMRTLGDATAEGLADEAIQNGPAWDLSHVAPTLALHPLFMITSDDGLAPGDEAIAQSVEAVPGAHVSRAHFATDHSYNDQRVALEAAVVAWLGTLPAR
jgi:hypothetical protein